jgi:RNA polymerase sigma-70 factor (ECF subfamily)
MTAQDDDRRVLTGLAYRMLGSLADAEDVVQDVFVRWHRHPNPSEVDNPRAYRAQVTVRLCIDRLKSARAKREVYVGPWLPEPVLDIEELRPGADALSELASDLSVALLLALERLSPLERAAFILHDVFEAEWSEVATTLGRSEAACRQLASRARVNVRSERPRFRPSLEERDRILTAFVTAVTTGDLSALSQLLAEDAVFLGDGGGEVKSTLKPVVGRDRVARLILGLQAKAVGRGDPYSVTSAWINGLPGLLLRTNARFAETVALDVDEAGIIHAVYIVSNPAKLRHLA